MSQSTLLASALFSFASAAVYGYVGNRLAGRHVAGNGQLAWQLFSIWWAGLALVTAIGGSETLLGAFGYTDFDLFLTLAQFNLVAICIMLWALLYYLLYLFLGRREFIVPLSLFYVFYYLLLVFYINRSRPVGVKVDTWDVGIRYDNQAQGPLFAIVVLLLLLPQIAGAIAYMSLLSKAHNSTQKYRISLVSTAIIVWFGAPLVATAVQLAGNPAWQVASRAIGLGAALMILAAYFPPRWIQQRFSIEALHTDVTASNLPATKP